MLSPFLGFEQRDFLGVYAVAVATHSGLAVSLDTSDVTPLTPTPYGNSFGTVHPATCTTANGLTETGWLMQEVSATGPSVFNFLSSVYDESIAAGAVASVLRSAKGAQVATDQYVASGGSGAGQILFDGSVAVDTLCAIAAGQPRTKLSGDSTRLQFKGQVAQRNAPAAIFQIV